MANFNFIESANVVLKSVGADLRGGNKEYTNVEKDAEDYDEEEWEEDDSCGGSYGELDKSLEWILECAGSKFEELEEVAV